MKCEHRRIKKIFTHGRKSKPLWECKDCKELIKRGEFKKELNKNRRRY